MGDTDYKIRSVALKWYFFTTASLVVYDEYCSLYMKQLGLSARQIGATTLLGVQHLFIPFILLLGDKFRARKQLIWIVTIVASTSCLVPLIPLIVNLPSCFGKPFTTTSHAQLIYPNTDSSLKNSTLFLNDGIHFQATSEYYNRTIEVEHNIPWMSKMFVLLAVSRSLTSLLEGVTHALGNLATITHLAEDRASFGSYYMWSQVGSGVSIVTAAVIAWSVRLAICDIEGYGYFLAFLVATLLVLLSMLSLPWLRFEYEKNRTVDWTEVKSTVFQGHYLYMCFMFFFGGVCVAFQIFWEFWYLDELDASPLVMGGAAMIRRPLLAVSIFTSVHIIKTIGDVNTISLSFLLFCLAFFALSFTRVFWYVLAIDMFQAAAYGLIYSAFTIHLSKFAKKSSSAVLLGLQEMFFIVGNDVGAAIWGELFETIGTRAALLCFAGVTAILLLILVLYMNCSHDVSEYEKVPDDEDKIPEKVSEKELLLQKIDE